MANNFDYAQTFPRRVINDSSLERFVWELHAVDTQYSEPFGHVNLTSASGQGFVPDQTVRPIRLFNLTFSGFRIHEADVYENFEERTNFNSMYAFFKKHGTHKRFIYNHPVYGDLVVRFGKPLSIPKKIPDGTGTLQSFDIMLIETITTHYLFYKGENLSGELPFYAAFYDVEVDMAEDTLVAPLGNNYEMIFKRARKPLRTYKVTVSGMQYFQDSDGSLNVGCAETQNMLLLELFYLKNRLSTRFIFNYLGEDIPVRFKEPISIPKVEGNTGVLGTVDLILIETPNKPLTEITELQVVK